jgi:hypothetical protein
MTTGYVTTLRNAQLDAITTAVGGGGKLQIYDGTRPATGGAATNKLAEFTLGTPFAPGAAAGVLSPTLPGNVSGLLAGTATWFRITQSGGSQVIDGSVSATGGGGDLQLNTTTISVGLTCSVTSFTITRGNP